MPDLTQLTIRLPSAAGETLRRSAFSARLQPAVLARLLLVQALEEGRVPPPAPPAPADLAPAARALLAALLATLSNLAQLAQHALELGQPLSQLATPGGPLAAAGDQLRQIGIEIKTGSTPPANSAALISAADQINSLARRLNQDRRDVAIADWHGPLSSLKSALSESN